MSLFPYLLLQKGLPDGTGAHGFSGPQNLNDGQNINAEPEERIVQATLSEINGAGDVEFVRNIGLRVRSGVRLPLKAPASAPNNDQFLLYGIVAEPEDEVDFATVNKCALVAAGWPWSRGWHDYGQFKPPADKGAERNDRVWQKALGYREGWRAYLKNETTVNLFSKQKGLWKAVLFDPNLADEAVVPGREYSLPRPKLAERRSEIVPSIYWGLCRDLADCTRALKSKEHTPRLNDLIEATIEGFLFKRYHAGHPKLDPRDNPWKNPETGDYEFHEMVHPSLCDTARAEQFMNHAIRLALAGPEDFEEFPKYPGRDRQPHRLVATQVQRIYLELVFNAHRRAIQAQYGLQQPRPIKREPQRKEADADPHALLDCAVEARVKFYSQQSDKGRKRALSEAMEILNFPAPVEWTATDEEAVNPDSQATGADIPPLTEACLQIVALAHLGVTDPRARMFLKEALEDSRPQVRFIVEYALAKLKMDRRVDQC